MTTAQKVALVETAWETYGLNRALAAVDLPKSTWYYHRTQKVSYEDKYAYLQPDLEEIARKHPSTAFCALPRNCETAMGTRSTTRWYNVFINCGTCDSCAVLDGPSPVRCGRPSSRPVSGPIW